MNTDHELIGHEHIYAVLKQLFCNKQMGHAYLFSGPRHVGKHTVARALLEQLPNKEILHIDRFIDKDGKRTESVTVDQIRDIIHALSLSLPNKEWYRVVFFNETECITQQAENALLKSLEEPPERTIFFFFEHVLGRMLPTIRSRCSFVRFPLVEDTHMRKAVMEKVSLQEDCDEIIKLSAGRPGIAHTLFSKDALESLKSRMTHFGRYNQAKFKKEDEEIAELVLHKQIQNENANETLYCETLARYDALAKVRLYSEAHVYQPGLIEAFL